MHPTVKSKPGLCSHGYLIIDNALAIPCPTALGEVVYCGELNESRKYKSVAHGDEPVHGRCVGHLWQRVASADAQSGHRKHCSYTWRRITKTAIYTEEALAQHTSLQTITSVYAVCLNAGEPLKIGH